MPRGGDVLNSGGVESREVCGCPDFAGEIQVWRAWHSLDGDDVRQTGVGVDMSSDDVEEVDQAAVFQAPGDFEAVLFANPAFEQLVAGVAHANDELVANPPRMARNTSKVKRSRLSSEPPYGGSSALVSGDQN